jgi:hypothetical protein
VAKVADPVQFTHMKDRPILADEEMVESALTTDPEATLHVSLEAKLPWQAHLMAESMQRNQHRLWSTGIQNRLFITLRAQLTSCTTSQL